MYEERFIHIFALFLCIMELVSKFDSDQFLDNYPYIMKNEYPNPIAGNDLSLMKAYLCEVTGYPKTAHTTGTVKFFHPYAEPPTYIYEPACVSYYNIIEDEGVKSILLDKAIICCIRDQFWSLWHEYKEKADFSRLSFLKYIILFNDNSVEVLRLKFKEISENS